MIHSTARTSRFSCFRILIILAITFATRVSLAKDLYVAPDGKNDNAGTKDAPLATVQKAQELASPGDTVFLRGGTYKMKEDQIAKKQGIFAYVTYLDKSGKSDKERINYLAFPGETPTFDLSEVKPAGCRVDAFYVTGSWLHVKGIEVIGVQVTITGHTQSICFDNEGNDNIFEQLKAHDGMGIGVYCTGGSRNLFLNCDSYRNYDSVSEGGRGGNVDGFGYHPSKGSVGNVFRGCRAWYNSDDGYDCINSAEAITFENCWAMYNGLSPDGRSLGDGNGFKGGGYGATAASRSPNPIPRHIIKQCLAVGNKSNGFYANHHVGGDDWLNNTAYKNGVNFNMLERLPDNTTDVPGTHGFLRNNLGFMGRRETNSFDIEKSDAKNNYFNLNLTITEKDFESLDEAQLIAPRQPNGDLPIITFMHLKEGSPLIDAGIDVKLPFKGVKPDLGAFEK